jgi:hypothetical protein
MTSVEKFVREKKLTYPIFIESASPSSPPGFGTFFNEFNVRGIPHAFVVTQEGRIHSHGFWLKSLWTQARNIAVKSD